MLFFLEILVLHRMECKQDVPLTPGPLLSSDWLLLVDFLPTATQSQANAAFQLAP